MHAVDASFRSFRLSCIAVYRQAQLFRKMRPEGALFYSPLEWNEVIVLSMVIYQIREGMLSLAPAGSTTSFCIWRDCSAWPVTWKHAARVYQRAFSAHHLLVTNLMTAASIIKSLLLIFHEPRSLEMPVHESHGEVIDLPKFSRTGPTNYSCGISVLRLSKLILVLDVDRC